MLKQILESNVMETTKYILTMVDSTGEKVLVSAQGDIVDVSKAKFLDSRANAEKSIKKIINSMKRNTAEKGVYKIWFDYTNDEPERFKPNHYPTIESARKQYNDALLMIDGALKVSEVKVKVQV